MLNYNEWQALNESEKKLGKFAIDSGSFLVVDPAYIDKTVDLQKILKDNDYKEGEYTFKGKNGNGVLIRKTGGDGTFEIIARYDEHKDNPWPHLPYEIVIKVRDDRYPKNK